MSESASTLPPARYDVIFIGETIPGYDPATVRRTLQLLFNIDDTHAERLFRAGRVVVKRDVDLDTARRFRSAFVKTGALVVIEPAADAATPAADATSAPAPAPSRGPIPAATEPATEPATGRGDAPFPAVDDAEIEETIIATAAAAPDPSTPRRSRSSPAVGGQRPSPRDTRPTTAAADRGAGVAGQDALALAPPGAPLDEIDDRVPIPFPDTSALAIEPGDAWTLADCQLPTPAAVLPPTDHLRLEPISPRPPRGAGERLDRPESANP